MLDLRREGDVFVIRWEDGENRFRDESVREWNRVLDEIEKSEGAKALVTTGSGKFYSNGLDLEFMFRDGGKHAAAYLSGVLGVLARLLVFPCTTVAAINGHAFGAGALLSLAHDYRVMRSDRGFWCMPEIDMRAFLHPGMTALIAARLRKQSAHEVIATGRRYGGADALAAGIAEHVAGEADLLPKAVGLAQSLAAKAHPVMSRLKGDLYPDVLAALQRPLETGA
jgi:enoyl-CoA hydratase/carnithine racemase